MKRFLNIISILLVMLSLHSYTDKNAGNLQFDQYFENKSLRIDYYLIGDARSEEFILEQLSRQNQWAGPQRLSTSSDRDLGDYRFSVYDSATNTLLFKQGFSSLFNEYRTTKKAKTEKESYYHVNLIPYPKNSIKYVLEHRKFDDGKFQQLTELYINPADIYIRKEKPKAFKYNRIQGGDNPHQKIDIAFVAEGYTQEQMDKFNDDVVRIWNYIASVPPFDTYKNRFNIYAVESPSEESGTDNPGKSEYKNTILNSSFYTFGTDRYLTTKDIKSLHDIAATVPYDQIFVVINSSKYGGGGFYNYYSATTADNAYSLKVAIHEFGHGFAGLADEYYDSEVAYEGFYNLKVEPWEPNITTLIDFNMKWKTMVDENTPVPTPRTRDYFETIGVFEGGGYATYGIYSPYRDCRMKSNAPKSFCPVCSNAITEVIKYYSE